MDSDCVLMLIACSSSLFGCPHSHMLVECLGTVEPLSVHKMDASRKLPQWEPQTILNIVQKVHPSLGAPPNADNLP
jgi:hypothetical protein